MLTTSQRNKQKNATQIVLQASMVRPFANPESFSAMAAPAQARRSGIEWPLRASYGPTFNDNSVDTACRVRRTHRRRHCGNGPRCQDAGPSLPSHVGKENSRCGGRGRSRGLWVAGPHSDHNRHVHAADNPDRDGDLHTATAAWAENDYRLQRHVCRRHGHRAGHLSHQRWNRVLLGKTKESGYGRRHRQQRQRRSSGGPDLAK